MVCRERGHGLRGCYHLRLCLSVTECRKGQRRESGREVKKGIFTESNVWS